MCNYLNAPRRDPFSPNFTYHLLIFELHSLDILNYNFSGYNRGIGLPSAQLAVTLPLSEQGSWPYCCGLNPCWVQFCLSVRTVTPPPTSKVFCVPFCSLENVSKASRCFAKFAFIYIPASLTLSSYTDAFSMGYWYCCVLNHKKTNRSPQVHIWPFWIFEGQISTSSQISINTTT